MRGRARKKRGRVTDRRARWRRWLLIALVIGVLALNAVFIAGWLMFQNVPSWYEPVHIPPEQLQAVRDDLVATFDGLSHAMANAEGPFDCRCTQDQVNAWMAAREEIWPMWRAWFPGEVTDPFVAFDATGVRLAGTCQRAGVQTVVNVELEVVATDDGIAMKLRKVSGGGLPIPKGWIYDRLAKLDREVWPAGKRTRYQFGDGRLPRLSDLFEGVVFPNGWVWQNPKRRFRVTAIKFVPGEVVVTLTPEPLDSQPFDDWSSR